MSRAADRIIVAIDTDKLETAERWIAELRGLVRHFKIGGELFTACGPEIIQIVRDAGAEVFLDLKFHDIPSTVAKSVAAAMQHGVWMMNVHTLGGKRMLEEAGRVISEAPVKRKPILIGVTMLTSMREENFGEIGIVSKMDEEVLRLARLARSAGLQGVVASAQEVQTIKEKVGRDFLVVTPGVRPAWSEKNDQARVVTPKEALLNGADYLVIGRPITAAANPHEACARMLSEC